MESADIYKALLGFFLGLVAKLIYDLWSEARKEKTLSFEKTVLSSFTISSLDKNIRDQTRVVYNNLPVESIHLVRVEVSNPSLSAIKNQAFTVRFSKDAKIIGIPKSQSSSEDLRYAEIDWEASTQNSCRFKLFLLRKTKNVSWDFAVINHTKADFQIEHGIITKDGNFEGVDLDVSSKVSGQKVQLDLVERLYRIISFLIIIQIITLVRNSIVFSAIHSISTPVANLGIIIFWMLILWETRKVAGPFMDWIASLGAKIDNSGLWFESSSIDGDNVNISGNDMEISKVVDLATMKKLLDTVIESNDSLSRSDDVIELPLSDESSREDDESQLTPRQL